MHSSSTRTPSEAGTELDVEKGERVADDASSIRKGESVEGTDHFLVKLTPDDASNPKNWSSAFKWYTTVLSSVFILSSTIASSLPSTIIANMMVEFETSQTVAILTITMFLLGYIFGPILWAPLSEVYGRKPIFVLTLFIYTVFNIGCALSPTITGVLLCRLISGIGASSPLTNSGGVLTDIWDMDAIAIPMAIFS